MTALRFGDRARRADPPHLSMRRNTGPFSIFRKFEPSAQQAWTGRPTASALMPASAEEVGLVRRSLIGSAGRVGPSGIEGSNGNGL